MKCKDALRKTSALRGKPFRAHNIQSSDLIACFIILNTPSILYIRNIRLLNIKYYVRL